MTEKNRLCQEFADVRAFHRKFDLIVGDRPQHLTWRKLKERVEFLLEELQELAEGCGLEIDAVAGGVGVINNGQVEQDLAQQADALVDLVYVALGTAVQLGLPWEALWDDVQRANMSKVRGMTKRGHQVDVTKPEGWRGPRTHEILHEAGYDRARWCAPGKIDEARCVDDRREGVEVAGDGRPQS